MTYLNDSLNALTDELKRHRRSSGGYDNSQDSSDDYHEPEHYGDDDHDHDNDHHDYWEHEPEEPDPDDNCNHDDHDDDNVDGGECDGDSD